MNRASTRIGALATAAVATCGLPNAALAAEYSWQVSGTYRDEGSALDVQTHRSTLHATYYLSPVDDTTGPYELAPFLNRSSHVAVAMGRTTRRDRFTLATFASDPAPFPEVQTGMVRDVGPDSNRALYTESGIDASDHVLAGRYVWAATGWYAGAQARLSDGNGVPVLPPVQTTLDRERLQAFAGRYFGPRTALQLALESGSQIQESRSSVSIGAGSTPGFPSLADSFPLFFYLRSEIESDNVSLSVRHVTRFGGSPFELSVGIHSSRSETSELTSIPEFIFAPVNPFDPPDGLLGEPQYEITSIVTFDSDREREVSLSGALFPTDAFGVRLTFSSRDRDVFGISDSIGLSANWFFLRNAAVEVELSRTDSGNDYGAISLHGRF